MPIYEYRCSHCGFEKEYLQKVSDPPVVQCPSCGEAAMKKKLTAAGFQLKGTGWYVTDFKNKDGGKPAAGRKDGDAADGGDAGASKSTGAETTSEGKAEVKSGTAEAKGGTAEAKGGTGEAKGGTPADSKASAGAKTESSASTKPATGS